MITALLVIYIIGAVFYTALFIAVTTLTSTWEAVGPLEVATMVSVVLLWPFALLIQLYLLVSTLWEIKHWR